ncbi:MAG: hypothetical protein IT383_19705, partial [Deltaproteobacteria bacterium]|nr:hypothetical protein [Deltaproteobacteria bacterium]
MRLQIPLLLLLAWCASTPAVAGSPVRISGVHFDGVLLGTPEPDSAVRLVNTDPKHPAPVAGFALSEAVAVKRKKGSAVEGAPVDEGTSESGAGGDLRAHLQRALKLPEGAVIPPGGEIWLAASAEGFLKVFGALPAFEAADTRPDVDDLQGGDFLLLPAEHGAVALLDDAGQVIDFLAYEVSKEGYYDDSTVAGLPWKGPAVRLKKTSFYGWKGQVLARDRDEQGRVLEDTNTAADWDSGFSRKLLGEEPTHRVEIAGQSRFVARPFTARARVTATSAPDNNYAELIAAIQSARKELRVRIYEMTNPKIMEELIKAKRRGVDVQLFLEGSPVGGIADQERWLADRAHKAGIGVYFLATPKGSKLKPRYRFDHSKYVIVDDRRAIIGTENYGRTGVPVFNSYGNRGWMVHVEEPRLVKQLREVWDADFRGGHSSDVIAIDAAPDDAYGLPFRKEGFVPDEELHRGQYPDPVTPLTVNDTMGLELVLSPDTSLNEHSSLLGMIGRAKKTLYVEQNSIRRRWGKKADSSDPDSEERDDAENAPNLALQAVVKAARRGVQVRVLLDSTWYNVQGDEDRDNDDTVAWLNELARREGLDVAAKVINLDTTHLEKIHAKGVIVDDREVFVGSINWTENSFKGNREVGVIIGHPKVAGYYAGLFRRDWSQSRIYVADVITKATIHASRNAKAKVLRRVGRGDRVVVVGEHAVAVAGGGKAPRDRPAWVEVQLGLGATGFIEPGALGSPECTPGEALHVIGREAVIVGRVAATNVSDRRVQLRFADEARPPFTAVIFKKVEPEFVAKGMAPASAFQGREVRVKGKVTTYRGPEMILEDPEQIA